MEFSGSLSSLCLLVGFKEEDGQRGGGTGSEFGVAWGESASGAVLAVAGAVESPEFGQAMADGGEVAEDSRDWRGPRRLNRLL